MLLSGEMELSHTKRMSSIRHQNFTLKGMWVLFGLFFMFSNFYQLDSHNNTSVALADL